MASSPLYKNMNRLLFLSLDLGLSWELNHLSLLFRMFPQDEEPWREKETDVVVWLLNLVCCRSPVDDWAFAELLIFRFLSKRLARQASIPLDFTFPIEIAFSHRRANNNRQRTRLLGVWTAVINRLYFPSFSVSFSLSLFLSEMNFSQWLFIIEAESVELLKWPHSALTIRLLNPRLP